MEHVAASAAALAGELAVGADDAVADGTLRLALERGGHVAAPGQQPVDEGALVAAAAEVDYPLRRHQPTVPFLLVDGDAVHRVDRDAREWVRGREPDGDLHMLLVDGDAGCDLARRGRDFDGEGLVGRGLRGCPFADGAELGGDDLGGDLARNISWEFLGVLSMKRERQTYFSVHASTETTV